ncbi:amidohydrolase family protein [Psychromarinibacter halotolerans]|uniref:Amidohydrolase family protein n=1 Tax=Psychromarinibacter halotolerans TaxID=1775175 RepID=A0ABV7GV14_9RHOB|nr:amidohydrolase family protein [Psychromarinibacter halotolerans]MDF0595266.1 amidohydrolase family protein [Psychromarinibacter halotolerans]
MIVDAHCHVWRRWPYEPPVPDPDTRAGVDQLVWHMDRNGVDHAVVIAAAIGDNLDNAADAFAAAAAHPGRLTVFPDLECRWSPTFRTPGAVDRLRAALDRWDMRGFTTYLTEEEDGDWLRGDDAGPFFALAEQRGLIASLSLTPHHLDACATLARRHPGLTILLHHHCHFGPRSATTLKDRPLAHAIASCGNVFVKLSGQGNVAGADEEYPYPDLDWLRAMMVELFPGRVVWGSDFPVSSRHTTYRQSMNAVLRHTPLTSAGREAAMGGTMARLLGLSQG